MIESIFRTLFFWIDQIIYNFIPVIYDFINILARQTLFEELDLQKFANNIYAILGIFMLFRLAFVLLNAIIDPDKLTNKQNGASKIFMKSIVALVLVVVIPFGFSYAFKLQDALLTNDVINKIIFGSNTDTANAGEERPSPGQSMGKTALSAFITCNTNADNCDETSNGDLAVGMNQAFPNDNSDGSFNKLSDILNEKTDSANSGDGKVYRYTYNAGISTICGGLVLFMLISFAFDIAVRLVKLGFLQLITPVAVIGYIEPKGGIFNNWLSTTVKTFINLFIRLLAISFMIYVLSLISVSSFQPTDASGVALVGAQLNFIRIFIIIGALIFAKEAPKFISDIFGIKDSGAIGSLNPFKKLGGMVGAGVVGGAAALALKPVAGAVGATGGAYSAWKRGGSAKAGAMEGFSKGAKNVSMKGGIGNLNKQLGGVASSWRQGSNAGATLAEGKDTKTGVFQDASQKYHDAAGETQRTYAYGQAQDKAETMLQAYNSAKSSGAANPYASIYSPKYADNMQNLSKYKDQLKDYSNQRELYSNRYRINPEGVMQYKDANGVEKTMTYTDENGQQQAWTNRKAYENANANYLTAEKYVTNTKNSIAEMDKLSEYKEDATNRALVESYENKRTPAFNTIPTPMESGNTHANSASQQTTTNSNAERTTNSGSTLPR